MDYFALSNLDAFDLCVNSLRDKAVLGAVFDAQWIAKHRELVSEGGGVVMCMPMAFSAPYFVGLFPDYFREDMSARLEQGLGIFWDQMTVRDKRELGARLKDRNQLAVCDEMLLASAVADEFCRDALVWPTRAHGAARPEFFVEHAGGRWGAECKLLHDCVEVERQFNQSAGRGYWAAFIDPESDPMRFQRAVVDKLMRAQGGGNMFLQIGSYTPWLVPELMQSVVRTVLNSPGDVGLREEQLPIGIACMSCSVVQGVWFSDSACETASIENDYREQIRRAVVSGFKLRGDGRLFSESDW